MTKSNSKKLLRKVAFTGNIGNGNLGDEISAASAVQYVRENFPDCELIAFSYYPGETCKRHKIKTYPASRYAWLREKATSSTQNSDAVPSSESVKSSVSDAGSEDGDKRENPLIAILRNITILRKMVNLLRSMRELFVDVYIEAKFIAYSYKKLDGVDLLVSAGGGQFSDQFGGAWNFPFSHYKWATLCRLRNIDVAFISVGVTKAGSKLSAFFIGRALNKAQCKSFRDAYSGRCAEEFGVKDIDGIFPDLAFAYQRKTFDARGKSHGRKIVGVSLFPHCDPRYWPEADDLRYSRYVEEMAQFSCYLLENGYQVHFFPTQIRSDVLVIEDVIEIIKPRLKPSLWEQVKQVCCDEIDELMNEIAQLDVAVVTRYHGLIMSFMESTPVIAVANHQKMFDIMNSVDLGKYALDIDKVTRDELIEAFTRLIGEKEAIVESLQGKVMANRNELMKMYDNLFSSYDKE